MSTQIQAPMQFVFQESEYRSRCTEAKVRYENTLETPVAVAHGAIVEFTPSSVESAFEDYHNYRLAGYAPLDPASPLPSISVINSPVTGALVTMYLLKPEAAQKAELEAIYADVRVEYQAELDRDLEAHIDRHVQLLIEAEDRAKAKEEAELQEKRRQEKHAEVLAARDKLRAELIEAGKLNNDGYAA
ncbi:BREX-1 system adenine-specific DNA-methyltransferase PglX [Pseudomonas glycinae]|uniref:BREX-1 system adenine-specific DNA-methyltransferase PglX n=1 Tax=Pseudomonas glycinae TaxID=1785145 RepID=UPI001F1B8970|nr:BREX-1 system adenine-specific DNA-methyltransferase PglX [Pseudomonas glycinae]